MKKNVIFAVVAIIVMSIIAFAVKVNHDNEILQLEGQLEAAERRLANAQSAYQDLKDDCSALEVEIEELKSYQETYEELAGIVVEDMAERTEFAYDTLLDRTASMATVLRYHGLPVPEYDTTCFSDLVDDWSESVEDYMDFICDKLDIG